jgi:hypothetical protein
MYGVTDKPWDISVKPKLSTYGDHQAAIQHAEGLAKAHPGIEYWVFTLTETVVCNIEPPTVTQVIAREETS